MKPQRHPSFPRCVLHRIVQQIAHHLVQPLPIAHHDNAGLNLLLEFRRYFLTHSRQRPLTHRTEINRRPFDGLRFLSRQHQKVRDQLPHDLRLRPHLFDAAFSVGLREIRPAQDIDVRLQDR